MFFFEASTVQKPHPGVQGFRGSGVCLWEAELYTSDQLLLSCWTTGRVEGRKGANQLVFTSSPHTSLSFFYVFILKPCLCMHPTCFQRSGIVHLEFINFYQVLAVLSFTPTC